MSDAATDEPSDGGPGYYSDPRDRPAAKKRYRVVWDADVEATSPREAAEIAEEQIHAGARVFSVTERKRGSLTEIVDLEADDGA